MVKITRWDIRKPGKPDSNAKNNQMRHQKNQVNFKKNQFLMVKIFR